MELSTMELTQADKARFEGRPKQIDAKVMAKLHLLGTYRRKLPVNLTRMMENAYDWEHLPFVHPSAFADIALVEEGAWGWRCKTALPQNGGDQLVELLVDKPRNYWATTVVAGLGEGVQIHTEACALSNGENDDDAIEVEVRFYFPQAPENAEQAEMVKAMLTQQYTQLYDEDEGLMLGRQQALDSRKMAAAGDQSVSSLEVGPESALDRATAHTITIAGGDYCLRFVEAGGEGKWVAHSATCPHLLGPLGDAQVSDDGRIICPWHGYQFDLAEGLESQNRCGKLSLAQCSVDASGVLQVSL